jgi:DNA repair protein SbcD/Mre11
MRVLHTSDWHLGRSFGPVSLLDDQQGFIDWLVELTTAERIELVVVAGDLYDRAVPPVEAIVMFRDAIRRLRATGATVVAITGNHDGADRVASYGDLIDASGVFLRGGFHRVGEVIGLDAADGPVDIIPIPFLDPGMAPGGERRTHHDVVAQAIAHSHQWRRGVRSLAIAHAFVAGGTSCDSERLLSIGGSSLVDASVFDGISYTALGHLHRPQALGEHGVIRYSGTPLAYSFSETEAKSVTVIEMALDGSCRIEQRAVPVGRGVATITGRLDDLLRREPDHEAQRSFVRAVITDPGVVLDAKARLAELYPYVVEIELRPDRLGPTTEPIDRGRLGVTNPLDTALGFWTDVSGEPPDAAVTELLASALDTARQRATS